MLSTDDEVGGSYRCVKGDASASVSLKSTLDDQHCWAFYAYVQDVVSAELRDQQHWFNEDAVESAIRDLPKWESGLDPETDTVKKYRDLFGVAGTHVIVSTNHGSRLELVGWIKSRECSSSGC